MKKRLPYSCTALRQKFWLICPHSLAGTYLEIREQYRFRKFLPKADWKSESTTINTRGDCSQISGLYYKKTWRFKLQLIRR